MRVYTCKKMVATPGVGVGGALRNHTTAGYDELAVRKDSDPTAKVIPDVSKLKLLHREG